MYDKRKIKIYLEISIIFHDPVIKRQVMFPMFRSTLSNLDERSREPSNNALVRGGGGGGGR